MPLSSVELLPLKNTEPDTSKCLLSVGGSVGSLGSADHLSSQRLRRKPAGLCTGSSGFVGKVEV